MSNFPTNDDDSTTSIPAALTAHLVGDDERLDTLPRLFGRMMMRVERTVYGFADRLCTDYDGGYWEYYELSNGGFYMAPRKSTPYHLVCENGFSGELSADAMGIAICLYTFSDLSFDATAPESIGQHFQYLREFAAEHAEASLIFRAID